MGFVSWTWWLRRSSGPRETGSSCSGCGRLETATPRLASLGYVAQRVRDEEGGAVCALAVVGGGAVGGGRAGVPGREGLGSLARVRMGRRERHRFHSGDGPPDLPWWRRDDAARGANGDPAQRAGAWGEHG